MNHVYRTVFNRARGIYQVASELARSGGQGSQKTSVAGHDHLNARTSAPGRLRLCALAALAACTPLTGLAQIYQYGASGAGHPGVAIGSQYLYGGGAGGIGGGGGGGSSTLAGGGAGGGTHGGAGGAGMGSGGAPTVADFVAAGGVTTIMANLNGTAIYVGGSGGGGSGAFGTTAGVTGGNGAGATFIVATPIAVTLTGDMQVGGGGGGAGGGATGAATVAGGNGGNAGNGVVSLSGGGTVAIGGVLRIGGANGGAAEGTMGGSAGTGGTGLLKLNGSGSLSATGGTVIGSNGRIEGASLSPFTFTLQSDISGAGSFTQTGTGTTVLVGTASHTGGTTISAGTLQLGNGGAKGAVTGNIANNASLVFKRSDNMTFDKVISGTGKVTQDGGGTTTLTGHNTYEGTTTINSGALQVGNGGITGSLGSGNVAIATNASLAFNRNNAVAVDSVISGGGRVTQMGSGTTTLSKANSYTGGTFVSGGTLALSGAGNLASTGFVDLTGSSAKFDISAADGARTIGALSGAAGSTVALGANTLTFGDGANPTFGGVIGGTGGIVKQGSGTTTLMGTNDYTGGTIIQAGALRLGNGGATGTLGKGAVINDGALVFNRNNGLTVSNAISGTGIVTQAGSGTTTLTGTNSYDGTTSITAGTLRVGDGGTTGSLGRGNVAILTNASLAFNRNNAVAVDSVISGGGRVTQMGSGTTTLSKANSYTGGTFVSGGTLALSGAGNLASTGFVDLTGSSAKFDISAADGARTIGALSGAAGSTVALGANTLTFGDATSQAFGGSIGGTGGLIKQGSGTATFTGNNSYDGTTTITAGTLQVGNGGATGSLGNGAVVNNGALVFNRNNNVTVGNAISGSGSVTQVTSKNLRLTGVSSYTGGTNVLAGTVLLNGAGTLASTGAVTLAAGAGFDIGTANGDRTIGALSGAAGSTVALGANTLTFGDVASLGFGGVIGGTGGIVKQGAGTTTLTGDNNYDGTTSINAGTLQVGNGGTTGTLGSGNVAIASNASLVLNRSNAMAVDSAISGAGRVTQEGSGTTTLSKANSYTGGTIVSGAGTLALSGAGSLASTGAVSLTGNGAKFDINAADGDRTIGALSGLIGTTVALGARTLTFGSTAPNQIFAGTIGGTGGLVKEGSGATTFTGTNAYSGGTTVNAGTLRSNASGAFVDNTAYSVNTGGALDLNGHNLTVSSLSGTGGTVALGSARLTANQSTDSSYAGAIGGAGGLLKTGTGKLTLSGINAYAGGTTINGGTLSVNGSVVGSVQVNSTGTLGGSGRIGGNVAVASGATLSAGNSPGTLTIGGNLTLGKDSITVFELGQSGTIGGTSNDLVSVGGNLTLGGTLQATASSAGWYRLFDYSAGGGKAPVTGSFDSTAVTGSSGFTAASHQISTTTPGGGTPGQVNLSVVGAGQSLQFWNGSTTTPGGGVVGGTGTWGSFGNNWTNDTGSTAEGWQNSVGVFAGASGGTVTVVGPQSFDTLQFATDGYNLVAGAGGALALAPITGSHGTVNTDAGIGASIAAAIVNGSGNGAGTGLIKVGSGTLTLSGANTYTGGTAINEGTLVAAGNSALGTGTAVVDNSAGRGATLQVNAGVSLGNAITLNNGGTLHNAGNIVHNGAGEIAVHSATGGATVHNAGGTLSATGSGGTGVFVDGTGGTTLASGVVHNTQGGLITADAFGVQIWGTGSVTNNASTIRATGSDGRGVEIGVGAGTVVNQGGGTIEGGMFGVDLFDGGSVSNTGGTIRATGSDPFTAGVIIGGAPGSVTNTGAGSLIQGVGAGVRLVNGGSITNGAEATIEGALAVHVVGGSATLSNAGTLLGDVLLGGISAHAVTLLNGSQIDGNLDIGANTASRLTLDGTAPQLYSQAVTGSTTFAGALVKAGAGTWTLDADLAPASTLISAGTLQLGDGGTTGSVGNGAITNNATLVVNRSDDLTLVNAIDGSGKLVKQGANTLGLTGANSYEGGTELKQGRIDLGHAQALGTGTLAMDDGTALGFTVDGLTIANAIHMTGNNDPVIDTGSFSETISGVISGAGFLTKEGTGALTLTGDNSYTGTTTIAAGTLQVGDGGTTGTLGSGAVTNNGALIFKRSDALTVTNAIDGSGSVTQAGSGTTTLSGVNSYTGATQVDAGTLRAGAVNTFSAASAHTVSAGATLDLAGFSQKVAGVTNAGTVNLTGSTPGTVLTVTGPWVGNGGTLALGTALGGNASATDKLLLSGTTAVASGTTNVRITNLNGLGGQTTGNGIEIVGTENGASINGGAFSLAAPVAAGAFEYRLNSTAGGAYLSSTSTAPTPGPSPTPGTSGTPLYRAEVPLLAALPEQLRQANLAMLGSMHQRMGDDGATRGGSLEQGQGQRQAWGRILTVDRDIQQGGTVSPSSEGRLTGFQAGTDLWATPNWRAGVYVGRLEGDMKVSGFARGIAGYAAGQNDLKNEYLGGYLTYRTDSGFYADGVLQAGRHRSAVGTAFGGPAGSNKASSLLASVEVGQAFALGAGWSIEPQLQLVHQRLNLQDTGLIGATVQQDAHNGWAVRAGLRVKGEFVTSAGTVQPYARLNVWHTSSGTDRARFIGPAAYADILTATGGTSTEAALGANWQVSPAVGVYGELGQLWASGGSAKTKGGPNASLGVKVRW